MTRLLPLLLLVTVTFFAACKEKKHERTIDKEKGITNLEKDDPEFLRLKDTAQKYLPEFITSLKEHAADTNYLYMIKSDYTQESVHEHMWSAPFRAGNSRFSALFSDSAYDITNVRPGDTVEVKFTDVEDWFIIDKVNGTRRGYFSQKYLTGEE
ncbi:MAG: DUF2314 domain-containing protein [Chitinophagaceae bacterium]